MPKRYRRKQSSDEADGFALLALIALGFYVYHRFAGLPGRWQVVIAVVGASLAFLLVRWVVRLVRRRNRQRLLLADARDLSPRNFELRVKLLLEHLGWERLEHVGGSGDQGVDLRGIYDGERCIVQCKRYSGRVGPNFVRELEGARGHERADRAFLITTGHFTDQGRDWARGKPIELWDGEVLARRFREQHEAARDPMACQRERRRSRRLVGALVLVNSLVVLWAALMPGSNDPTTPVLWAQTGPAGSQNASLITIATPTTIATRVPAPVASARSCGQATISGVEGLAIRAAPALNSQKIGERRAGTVVELLCDAPQQIEGTTWRHVRTGELQGWMSARFLR